MAMNRREALAWATFRGGKVVSTVDGSTTLLVVGGSGWPLSSNGRLTLSLRTARRFQGQGKSLRIISEAEFFQTGSAPQKCLSQTLAEIHRTLDIPLQRLRGWVQTGSLLPVGNVHRLQFFDFAQICRAKALANLLLQGVSPAFVGRGLRQLRRWLPISATFPHFFWLQNGRQIAFRAPSGQLTSLSGQLLLDFAADDDPEMLTFGCGLSAAQSLAIILHLEEKGEFVAAAEGYERWLTRFGDDPQVWLNLGNVFVSLRRHADAVAAFRAAVALDPHFAEAWNNLGSALYSQDRLEDAIFAFRRALASDANCFDAQYNLADALTESGHLRESSIHWRAYLAHDRHSQWGRYAKAMLKNSRLSDAP